jgi:hypothetical protein
MKELFLHPKLVYMILEFLSLALLILFSLLIFNTLNKLKTLTGHKGIYFLEKSFLFFGITFLFSFIVLLQRLFNFPFLDMRLLMLLTLFLNLVALGYLFFSMFSKNLEKFERYMILFSLFISILGGFFRNTFEFLFTIQILLFFIFLCMLYYKFRSSNKPNKLMLSIYLFLVIFWILSGIGIHISRVLELNREFLPIFKVILFGYIWYTIHKRFGK